MKRLKKQKGQATLTAILGWGLAIALATFASYSASSSRTDEQVNTLRERTAKLETSVPLIQVDIREIKDSIKSIERSLRITK